VSLPVPVALVVKPVKPVLKVNGIAFQDGADSVAVINGITVSNGSVIEGARVEEIHKDHVKFSRDGEKFYIILEKSN
jgi:type II secretory pathway component PulC